MAECSNKIMANILSTCENKIVAGIEQTIWLFNREDLNFTFDVANPNEITSIGLAPATKKAYIAKGLKKNLTAGFERVVSDTAPDTWTNTLTLVGYEFSALKSRNIDEMGDLVAIIERKGNKNIDGTYLALGVENGLYVSTDTWAANDNGGARSIEMSSLDDAGESYSSYIVTLKDQVKEEGGSEMITTPEELETYLNSLVIE